MNKKLLNLQSIIIGAGTLFAWYNLVAQFRSFYATYGTIFRFRNCIVPNPFLTPCFYGSLAFLAALVWSVAVLRNYRPQSQRRLKWFLLFGTLFAFSVFGYETAQFYRLIGGPQVGCVVAPASPFLTPCFFGGLFFLASFVTSIIIVRSVDKGNTQG